MKESLKERLKEFGRNLVDFLTSRLFIMAVVIVGVFCFIIYQIFTIQIVNGQFYQMDIKASILRTLTVSAARGKIYDRYGRPLALNEVSYVVKIDNSINVDIDYASKIYDELYEDIKKNGGNTLKDLTTSAYKNQMYLNLINEIEGRGGTIADEFPISKTTPYTFSFGESVSKEYNWKKEAFAEGIGAKWTDEQIKEFIDSKTADDTMQYLCKLFKIPEWYSEIDKRKVTAIRYAIYEQRYRQYKPITVASDISENIVAYLEEKNELYPGVYIDTASMRVYPENELFSHILGYIRAISDDEYSLYKEYGYTSTDIVGKTGIEKTMELELNGTDGTMYVEVDSLGRRINTVEIEEAIPGNDVFLTIDKDLQEKALEALVEEIKNVLLIKLDPGKTTNRKITLEELFVSMINADRFSVTDIWTSNPDSYSYYAKMVLTEQNIDLDSQPDAIDIAKQAICDAVTTGKLSLRAMVLIMYEQKLISGDENYVMSIATGVVSPLEAIKQKIREDEITPQDTALDPCTGSVIVENVNTGEVLALVTYPTYDNNELVNNFNYDYYKRLLEDPTNPLINRPLLERKAPGSTLKMVTALAGLETGYITPEETIFDNSTFDKAGKPTANCWIYPWSHGEVDLKTAIEVSCNYFFYELAYRMGNAKEGTRLQSIQILNKYMTMFGLNATTGIEIGEYAPQISSPEVKENAIKSFNPDAVASQLRWTDGDTIRTAIGQGYNNFTVANMAKYIATLANGGTRYSTHIISKVTDNSGKIKYKKEAIVEEKLELKQENMQVVYEGMLAVTTGSQGTLTNQFMNYPVKVAGKSGTAEESSYRSSHAWFVGYAPYDEPEISIAVMIPFGDSTLSAASAVAKRVIYSYMGYDKYNDVKSMDNIFTR